MLENLSYDRILLIVAFGAMLVKAFYAMARYDNREAEPVSHGWMKAFGVLFAILSCLNFVQFFLTLRGDSSFTNPYGQLTNMFTCMGLAVYLCLFRSSRSKWYVKVGKFLMGALLYMFYATLAIQPIFSHGLLRRGINKFLLVSLAAFIVMFIIIIRRKPKRAPAVAAQAEEPSGGAPAKPARVFAEDESEYAPKTAGSAPESGGAAGRGGGEAGASAKYAEALLKEASAFDAADEAHEAPPAGKPDGGRGSGEPENRTRRLLKRAGAVVLAALVVSGLSFFSLIKKSGSPETLSSEILESQTELLNSSEGDSLYLVCTRIISNHEIPKTGVDSLDEKNLSALTELAWKKMGGLAYEGNPDAQFYYASKFEYDHKRGEWLDEDDCDYEKSAYWYLQAAKQGHPAAQYYLAFAYYYGEGVSRDYEKALYWMRLSAENEDDDAQLTLGNWYYKGLCYLPQNTDSAMYWWRKSAAQGNEDAKKYLEKIYD